MKSASLFSASDGILRGALFCLENLVSFQNDANFKNPESTHLPASRGSPPRGNSQSLLLAFCAERFLFEIARFVSKRSQLQKPRKHTPTCQRGLPAAELRRSTSLALISSSAFLAPAREPAAIRRISYTTLRQKTAGHTSRQKAGFCTSCRASSLDKPRPHLIPRLSRSLATPNSKLNA
jgi:hypothetical protein